MTHPEHDKILEQAYDDLAGVQLVDNDWLQGLEARKEIYDIFHRFAKEIGELYEIKIRR